MGVRKKHRRRITLRGKKYVWYILAGDRDYWERVELNDWETAFLHIVSEDKSLILSIPLAAPRPYAVSKGSIFQGRKTSGCWERYAMPFDIPKAVTPRFVAEVIDWAENGSGGVSEDYGGDLLY